MRILGVDPGSSGAIAMFDTGLHALVVCDMPSLAIRTGQSHAKRIQLHEVWLADQIREYDPDYAWVERVHSMPKQGVASSFAFGVSYGLLRGVLAGLRIPTTLVTPNEWKRHFRLNSDKNEARAMAARTFPDNSKAFSRVKDDGRAEASLLALFGARQQEMIHLDSPTQTGSH